PAAHRRDRGARRPARTACADARHGGQPQAGRRRRPGRCAVVTATDPRYARDPKAAKEPKTAKDASDATDADSADEDTRSPEEIEADLTRTRAALTATVDELSDRVDPRVAVRRMFRRDPGPDLSADDPAYEERRRTRA